MPLAPPRSFAPARNNRTLASNSAAKVSPRPSAVKWFQSSSDSMWIRASRRRRSPPCWRRTRLSTQCSEPAPTWPSAPWRRERLPAADLIIGGFDISTDIIGAIEAGDIAFTVDQQQYVQGYLPIVLLYLYNTNLNTVGGGLPILTGPGFVDTENVGEVQALVEAGTR